MRTGVATVLRLGPHAAVGAALGFAHQTVRDLAP